LDFRPELSWEFKSEDEITARSIRAVRNHILHLKEVSQYYKESLKDVNPKDITSLESISDLPITSKSTIADNVEKFWAIRPEDVIETVITSGSTGHPLVFFLTANDMDRLAFNEALSFHSVGVTVHDRAQILVSLDRLFIAGIAYYRGLTLLGANTTRIGVLPFEMQKHYLELLKPTVIVGVPSFLRKLFQKLSDDGFDSYRKSIQKILCIGESIRDQDLQLNILGKDIENLTGGKVYSTYGNTELEVGYCECEAQHGNHSHPELVYSEIVDDDGNPVPDGQVGELVATPLGVEGVPLLRYRTGDITFKIPGQCRCGRNSMRIGPILSRKSHMIKIKGTTIYPLTITNALDELPIVKDYIVLIEGSGQGGDTVTIHTIAAPAHVPQIAEHLRSRCRVSFPVLVSNAPTLTAFRGNSRKQVKIIDKRPGKR